MKFLKRFNRVRLNAKNGVHSTLKNRRKTIIKRRANSVIHRNRMYSANVKIPNQQRPQSLTRLQLTASQNNSNVVTTFANKEMIQFQKVTRPTVEYV